MAELKVISGKEKEKKNTLIKDASDVYKAMRFLESEDRENFYVLCLDAKNYVTHTELVSIGTLTNSLAHPREAFRAAIKNNSASVIFAHNHPSGDPAPSRDDIEFSIRLVNAGEIIGIRVLDHVIIGGKSHFSMAEENIVGFNQQGKIGLIAQKSEGHFDSKAEELYHKLDFARTEVMIELFKMEALIKLGDAVTMEEVTDDTEDSVNWLCVFQILADIKNKAMEKVGLLETLIYDFKSMEKKEA